MFIQYVNNKGADQSAHLRSLINTFVVRCLDSIEPLVSIPKISSLYLASMIVQAGLSLPWSQTQRQAYSWRGSYINNENIIDMYPTLFNVIVNTLEVQRGDKCCAIFIYFFLN